MGSLLLQMILLKFKSVVHILTSHLPLVQLEEECYEAEVWEWDAVDCKHVLFRVDFEYSFVGR